jgi:hypothetical protein
MGTGIQTGDQGRVSQSGLQAGGKKKICPSDFWYQNQSVGPKHQFCRVSADEARWNLVFQSLGLNDGEHVGVDEVIALGIPRA